MPGLRGVNVSKVRAELTSCEAREAERLAFLVLPGSFNPIHSQHLRALEIARDVMQCSGWHVIGGFLAPSDEHYVREKIGTDAWPLHKRLELCQLATETSSWVDVTPWAEFNSFRAARRLQHVIESTCGGGLAARRAIGVVVMGSDTALRILRRALREWEASSRGDAAQPRDPAQWVCCLMRPGVDGDTEIREINVHIRPRVEPLGIKIVVSDDPAQTLLEVSSQAIRSAIKDRRWDELRDRRWLDPKVLDRLRSAEE